MFTIIGLMWVLIIILIVMFIINLKLHTNDISIKNAVYSLIGCAIGFISTFAYLLKFMIENNVLY